MRHYYTLDLFFALPNGTVGMFREFEGEKMHLDECVERVCVAFSRRNHSPFPIVGVQVYKRYRRHEGRVYGGFINTGEHSFHKVLNYIDFAE